MSVQLIIIVLYFLLTIAIGLYAQRKTKSSASFHGAGLGVLMVVSVGVGEWLGGTSTTGVSEYGFAYGLSGSWYTLANGVGIIFLALLFAKLYRSLETVTIPGIVEKYVGVNARVVSSVLLIFVMIAVGTAQVIAAGTLGVTVLHMSYTTSVIVLGIGFIIYTLAGGMTAIGYTNIMHLIAMYGGVLLALYFVAGDIGGFAVFKQSLPEKYFDWTSIGMPTVSSWVIASVLGACTAQAGIQPILAAKDVNVAKKAAIITAFAVAPFGIFTALLGMAAKIQMPQLTNAKLALPSLLMNMNPVVGGIVLASIMAAILSTISPIILASGTMFTKDIYQRIYRPGADDRQILKVSRLSTGIAGLVCIVLAIVMYGSTRILDMVYFAYTIRGSLFVILLLGIYWRKTSNKGAIYGMIITAAIGLFWVAYKATVGHYPISNGFTETYAAVVGAFLSTVIISLLLPGKKEESQSISQ